MWRLFYPELSTHDPVPGEQAEVLADRPYELAEFLVHVVGVERLGAVFHGKVTYHASCHLLHELRIAEEPRQLISQVEGTELVPMDLAEQCCGFGDTFAVQYPEISDAILQKKIASLKCAGVDTLKRTVGAHGPGEFHLLILDNSNAKERMSRRGSFVVRNSTEVGHQRLETRKPGVRALCTPDPLGKNRALPAAAPLATAAPVTTAVAIGTLLLRPGFIHDQGPPRKLRTMQSLDGLLRLSRRTHIDKTKSPRLPGIFVGNDAGGFNRTMC